MDLAAVANRKWPSPVFENRTLCFSRTDEATSIVFLPHVTPGLSEVAQKLNHGKLNTDSNRHGYG